MLSCKQVAERASDLIDDELGLWDRLRMRLHLAMCHGCAHFVDQIRQTRALARLAGQANAPTGDDARIDAIFSRLHEDKTPGQ